LNQISTLKRESKTMVNLFVRALIITAIIVAVTDAIVFYVIWSGKAQITPLFVILVIIVTMVPMAINLWVHIFRQLGKVSLP
jgi:magnesium-transporting ATPase (P-type)